MMKENNSKIHLVPQPVIDCAENLATTRQEHLKHSYIMRLEAIRDYCEDVLKKANNRPAFTVPVRKKSVIR